MFLADASLEHLERLLEAFGAFVLSIHGAIGDAETVEHLRGAGQSLRSRVGVQIEGAVVAHQGIVEVLLETMRSSEVEVNAGDLLVVRLRRVQNVVEVLAGLSVFAHFEQQMTEHENVVRVHHLLLLKLHVFRGESGALIRRLDHHVVQIVRRIVGARVDTERRA